MSLAHLLSRSLAFALLLSYSLALMLFYSLALMLFCRASGDVQLLSLQFTIKYQIPFFAHIMHAEALEQCCIPDCSYHNWMINSIIFCRLLEEGRRKNRIIINWAEIFECPATQGGGN